MFADKVMINANDLMKLAWENPLLDEADCAILFEMIMQLIKSDDGRG